MKKSQQLKESGMDLFSSFKLGPLTLANRMVMAPLTRNRAKQGDIAYELHAKYYAQRASAGLIITEASPVCAEGIGYPHTPGIYSQQQIDGWKLVTDAVHAKGGCIYLQLWYTGRISHPSLLPGGALPVAPSAIKPAGEAVTYDGMQPYVTPRALETDELPAIIEHFRQAAYNARQAGFDGVEVHGANGYLLDQFLRDGTNQRSDEYGGSVENRARLLLEVVETVVDVWGGDRVGIRLSPINLFNDMHDSDPDTTFNYVAAQLNRFGLAYLHVVEGTLGMETDQTFDYVKLRNNFKGPYMANGGYDKQRANDAIASGNADLVSFGALYIANPDLAERFASDAPLNTPDPDTFYGGDEHGYTDYPFMEEK